jgi:GDP-L-fucose synthase
MKLLITGGSGMIGRALKNIGTDAIFLSSKDCDLKNLEQACDIIADYKPTHVLHLAAKVGGVQANSDYLGDFYFDNILINTNTLEACKRNNVSKVLSMLSTCIFPDTTKYPLTEEQMHSGPPHPSNFAYAHVKRMLDVQSRAYRQQYGCNFITAVPNNLYGEYDNFDLEQSHVIPAIIRKVHEAKMHNKEITLWGDGSPLREFTYSADLARVLLFLLEKYNEDTPINIGSSNEISIKMAAEIIASKLDYKNKINWDTSKPAGQFKKPSDKSKMISLGWTQNEYTSFEDGIEKTCDWFLKQYPEVRGVK